MGIRGKAFDRLARLMIGIPEGKAGPVLIGVRGGGGADPLAGRSADKLVMANYKRVAKTLVAGGFPRDYRLMWPTGTSGMANTALGDW